MSFFPNIGKLLGLRFLYGMKIFFRKFINDIRLPINSLREGKKAQKINFPRNNSEIPSWKTKSSKEINNKNESHNLVALWRFLAWRTHRTVGLTIEKISVSMTTLDIFQLCYFQETILIQHQSKWGRVGNQTLAAKF